jgi:hypothetical protein
MMASARTPSTPASACSPPVGLTASPGAGSSERSSSSCELLDARAALAAAAVDDDAGSDSALTADSALSRTDSQGSSAANNTGERQQQRTELAVVFLVDSSGSVGDGECAREGAAAQRAGAASLRVCTWHLCASKARA